MRQQVVDSLVHTGSAGGGVLAMDTVNTGHNTIDLVLKLGIGIVSLIPTFKALFNRKKTN